MLMWRASLLGLLVFLALTQATHATLGIYLRATLLSWDSPSSQHQDGLASQSLPWADSFTETLAHARAAAGSAGRLSSLPADRQHTAFTLSSGITRSPPAR